MTKVVWIEFDWWTKTSGSGPTRPETAAYWAKLDSDNLTTKQEIKSTA